MSKKTSNTPPDGRRRLILCVQPKGSAGKTTFLAALTAWYQEHPSKPKLALFDPDSRMRTLTQIFGPEGSSPLPAPHAFHALDWNGDDGNIVLDNVCRSLLGDDGVDVAILDGVANQDQDVFSWAQGIRLYANAQQYGFDLTFVILVDETADTATGAIAAIKEIGARADVIVVRNQKDRKNLPWDKALMESGKEIPRLYQLTFEGYSADIVGIMQGTSLGRPHSLHSVMHQNIDKITAWRALSCWERFAAEIGRHEALFLPVRELAAAK